MVIIKSDDYISFLNSTGVKMPTPPSDTTTNNINNNNSNNNSNNSSNNSTPTSTIKRDNSQHQLQQLQQFSQQLQQQIQQLAKAVLICRQNSHPFPSRTLLLETNKPVKIGRAIARTKVSDNNAIFDCKVLSRNHAELWYDEGKFFIKDTGSSNGTFVNNQRLSQTCNQSEPFEVSSGDIVQFGVDVMENSRKETHGCIVATLKLYLPDGRETKASQSTVVGATNTKIPQVDLYRLNQYIQEAIQREQNLEHKLLNIQKKVDLVRKTSSTSWQALVDEDRLLSRIDMLEKKLLCFSKTLSEDKLREEIVKLQNEKMLYQSSAKQALKKVYNERMEAVQKLSSAEKALCSTEDECSLLRDQLNKNHSQSQETNQRLDAIQTQLDDKCSDFEEQIYKKDNALQNLNTELNELQEKLGTYKAERQNDSGDFESSQLVTNWLLKSDIKNIDGSEDIIKAICGDEDDEANLAKSLENNCSQIYLKMFSLEKELNLLLLAPSQNNNINNNNNNNNNNTDNNSNGSEISINVIDNDSTSTINEDDDDNDEEEEQQQEKDNELKPEMSAKEDEDEDEKMEQSLENQLMCDDNQNNMNKRLTLQSSVVNIENNIHNATTIAPSGERIRANLKQLLALYAKLKRQIMEFTEVKANEHSSTKAKCDEMANQLNSLKFDLEARPTQEDFENKQQQCVNLRSELSTLTEQVSRNEQIIHDMKRELSEERELHAKELERMTEIGIQTDDIKADEESTVLNESLTMKPLSSSRSSSKSSSPEIVVKTQITSSPEESLTAAPQSLENLSPSSSSSSVIKTSTQLDDDDVLNNHPKVLYEDELIVFKEKCTNLTNENVRLQREITEMRQNFGEVNANRMHNFMLKYLVPILVLFVAYIFYLLK